MGLVSDLKQWFLDDLYREPRGGKGSWLVVALGILAIAYGSAGLVLAGAGAHFLLLGGAFLTTGAAELVPPERIGLARTLRVGSWVAFVLFLGVVAGPPLLAASVEAKVAAVGGVLFLLAVGRLLYAVFTE